MTSFQYPCPIGTLLLVSNGNALIYVGIFDENQDIPLSETPDRILLQAKCELDEYFAGTRTYFSVPLEPHGTPFQMRVWQILLSIPYGQTMSYGEVAAAIGNKQASRAVGGAVSKNPILIMIPCHRVLAAEKGLGGFSAGLSVKRKLHDIEHILTI